ncbi:MAG: pilus assembly protein [Marinilabiliales bacterium]|nr:pilus assembly protein [Marinilabiliales bacterium]
MLACTNGQVRQAVQNPDGCQWGNDRGGPGDYGAGRRYIGLHEHALELCGSSGRARSSFTEERIPGGGHEIRNQRGQSMTEVVIFLPIYLLLIFGMIFARAYYIKQQTLMAAKYAAWQKGDFNTEDAVITENVKKYFFEGMNKDRVSVERISSSEAMDEIFGEGESHSGAGRDQRQQRVYGEHD